MKILYHNSPPLFLRLGLSAVYLYSGYSLLNNPQNWEWALRQAPSFVYNTIEITIGVSTFLQMQGAVELLIAFVFLAWFLPKQVIWWAALTASTEMLAIISLVGVNSITYRDMGLLGANLALLAMYRYFPTNN